LACIRELSLLSGGGLNARLKDVQGSDLTIARDRFASSKHGWDCDGLAFTARKRGRF